MNIYYQEKFNKVLEYIHLNLDDKLDIKTLSEVAFISEYHFHRLIKAYLDEALGTYIKRIRVETGAKLLKYSDNSITDIAYKIGYETPTSFNKSFKKHFDVSPTQFRKEPLTSFESVKQKKERTNFKITVVDKILDSFDIMCHPSKGKLNPKNVATLWKDLVGYASQNEIINKNTKFIGIHWDDPSITEEDNIRYDACLSTDKVIKNSPFPMKKIRGGKYLCFTYIGDDDFIGDVYDQIIRDHILEYDIQLRDQPPFEIFITDRNTTLPKDRIIEIYFPV